MPATARPMPALLVLSLVAETLAAQIDYRLEYPDPAAGRVQVSVRLHEPAAAPQTLIMPRAIPMGYGEQHYDRFVDRVRAFAEDGTALEVHREEGPRWRLGGRGTRLARFAYEVDVGAMERRILDASDASKFRPGYLGLLGYSVFGFLEGSERRSVELTVAGPARWPVYLTLAPRASPATSSATARAVDFYALADSQILLGPAVRLSRIGTRPPLYLAVYAEGPVDAEATGRLAREAFERVVDYFGAGPLAHYTVHLELLRPLTAEHSYGFSMEHLESGTFFLSAAAGITAASTPDEQSRFRFNLAHHMAHAWIPKRGYGEGYFPFQWELAPLIDTIWFAEGFGQYAAIAALTNPLPAPESERARREMTGRRFGARLEAEPLFLRRLSLIELSRVASTRYSADFRTGQAVFARGGMMAAEMDDRIREATRGLRSLRDALRYVVAWTAKSGRGFRPDELPGLVKAATGVDVDGVYRRWIAPREK